MEKLYFLFIYESTETSISKSLFQHSAMKRSQAIMYNIHVLGIIVYHFSVFVYFTFETLHVLNYEAFVKGFSFDV